MTDNRSPATGQDAAQGSARKLTLADLTRELEPLGMTRTTIVRYHEAGVRDVLGADGTTYPAEALSWWEQVAAARRPREEGGLKLRPEQAADWLRSVMRIEAERGGTSTLPGGTTSLIPPPPPGDRSPVTGQEALVAALQDHAAALREFNGNAKLLEDLKALPPPGPTVWDGVEDRLITVEEAERLMGCSASTIRRRGVLPVTRGRFSYVEIQEWIAREKAKRAAAG